MIEIAYFLVGCGFSIERATRISQEFIDLWYIEHTEKPTVEEFLMWLEGEI
ncbi:hypothetical protein ABOONEI_2523 [Aciduliprofundum boonei T469]|nr:hypothetical protein ABOONEI_2523 [Aciduliprofundum boonei T469]